MELPPGRVLKADLHVHTRHSRLATFPVLGARDCYADPREAYQAAKDRGMDLVTFTDHDTIDGCKELLDRMGPREDFFLSEEVTTRDPRTGLGLHVSVFGIDEARHRDIQRLRGDVWELLRYLRGARIPVTLNHPACSFARRRPSLRDLGGLLEAFPLVETLNGAEPPEANDAVATLAGSLDGNRGRRGRTGGSDAHTLRRIGSAWTEANASDRSGFLQALHRGEVRPGGVSCTLLGMTRDVYSVVLGYYGDLIRNRHGHFTPAARARAAAAAVLSAPLHLAALPATGTLVRFARVGRTARRIRRQIGRPDRGSREPVSGGKPAASAASWLRGDVESAPPVSWGEPRASEEL